MPTTQEIRERLKQVYDPEVHISIIDLGLIYDVEVQEGKKVFIKMTLTSPMCPAGPEILSHVHMAAKATPGIEEVKIDLIWTPPWDPRKMATEEGKAQLGIWEAIEPGSESSTQESDEEITEG
jgi:metal-sulfur cluster biosynthetic enzyme